MIWPSLIKMQVLKDEKQKCLLTRIICLSLLKPLSIVCHFLPAIELQIPTSLLITIDLCCALPLIAWVNLSFISNLLFWGSSSCCTNHKSFQFIFHPVTLSNIHVLLAQVQVSRPGALKNCHFHALLDFDALLF